MKLIILLLLLQGPTYTVPSGVIVRVEAPFSVTETETRCDNWPNKPTVLPCHVEVHVTATGDPLPTIEIVTPANGAKFSAGNKITMSVDTNSEQVEFFANNLLFTGAEASETDATGVSRQWATQKWIIDCVRLPNGKCKK